MKIWHLISNRWNSAISEYALSMTKVTRDLGASVEVTPLTQSPIEARLLNAKFDVKSIDHFGPGRFGKLISMSNDIKPDIIFTYGGPETTAALFMKGNAKLVRVHGYKSDGQNLMGSMVRRMGHLRVDRIIVPSKYIAEGLGSLGSLPVSVLTLGCDTEVFQFRQLERGMRPEILIFGRLDPVKGHREFLRTFKKILELSVANQEPRPLLRITGLPANLSVRHLLDEARAIDLSTDDIVIQCERVSDVSGLLSKATMGVVSSLGSEAICRVAEEFLLCGTPVATTDVGSLPEVFEHKSFGVCYGKNNDLNAPHLIYEVLRKSYVETFDQREKRASFAKSCFSLQQMKLSLEKFIANHGTDIK